jgi:VWFA-related protein
MHRLQGFLGLGIVLVISMGAPSSAQAPVQEIPIFGATAELVEVIVRVTDKQGRFVPGLTQTEFELREEGRPQPIVAFNRVDLPRPAVPPSAATQPVLRTPAGSTVATNAEIAESRAFVLLLDDMLTSPHASRPARQAAREFVQRFVGPTDLVAAFSTSGRGTPPQEFTTDKARVLATVDRFLGRRCRTSPTPQGVAPRTSAYRQESEVEKIDSIRSVSEVIEALARHLSGIRGRRVSLLWISEGVDYDVQRLAISGPAEPGSDSGPDPAAVMQRAIGALQRANVTLYAVDPRRLYSPEQLLPEELPEGMPPETALNPLCREANAQELTRSLATFREFSAKTGGFAAVSTDEFTTAFSRVLDESSQYYVLGYQPRERGRDGEFKRIDVRTKRPGLQVSARTGYVVSDPRAPTPGPPGVRPALAAVLTSSLPAAGLPLRVQAIPRRGANDRGLVYVIVEVGGKDLQFAEANGRFTERIEFGLVAIDGLARQSNVQPVAMDLSLTPRQVTQVRTTGLRWVTTADLAPGRYSLRVASQAMRTNRSGSVFLDVDVPAFDDDALRIDGVALTSLPAALTITLGASSIPLGLTGPPTAARTFVKGDVITIGVEIGTPRAFTTGAVDLAVAPLAGDTARPPVLQRTLTLADRTAVDQPRLFVVNTAELAAGPHVLHLTVRDAEGKSATTTVLFEVVERQGR